MKLKFYIFITILFPQLLNAQSISGAWTGVLYQETGATRSEYYFNMNLKQTGNKIEGNSYIRYFDKSDIFASMDITGTVTGNIFKFKENKIINQREDLNMRWCIKYGELKYSETKDKIILQGKWNAPGCVPGQIYFERKKENKNQANTKKQEKREIKTGNSLTLKSKKFTVKLFDHGTEDGDIITLYYNNKIILEKYTLSKTPKVLNLEFDTKIKKNKLVLYAENLGTKPPNTAAVIIEAGTFKKKITLRSDLNVSDVIYFEYQK